MQVTVEVPEQFARYVEIVIKPFVKVDDVTKLLECSTSCAYKELTKLKLKKYPWGWNTQEVCRKTGMKNYYDQIMDMMIYKLTEKVALGEEEKKK